MLVSFKLRVTTSDGEIFYCTETSPGEDGWYSAIPARVDGGMYPPLRPVRFMHLGRTEERLNKTLEVRDGNPRALSGLPVN